MVLLLVPSGVFLCEVCNRRTNCAGITPQLLDTQYRMHPSIASFPSAIFYENRLKTGIVRQDRPLPIPAGVCFYDTTPQKAHDCLLVHAQLPHALAL